jgi:hypothetical protein
MRRSRFFHASALAAALALAGAAGMVAAQDDGGDKIDMNQPIDASGSYQVDNDLPSARPTRCCRRNTAVAAACLPTACSIRW